MRENWISLMVVGIGIGLLVVLFICAGIKGDPSLLDCDNHKFNTRDIYYSCVQTREVVRIRELLESYD